MHVSNDGALAVHVFVTGLKPDSNFVRQEIQKLAPGEVRAVYELAADNDTTYCRNVRVRGWDVLGNKYITEYRHFSGSLSYPTFRYPWLGQGIEEPPEHCSDEVSWELQHFERSPGFEPEAVEEGYDIDAPV
jgi:hypothetical protein